MSLDTRAPPTVPAPSSPIPIDRSMGGDDSRRAETVGYRRQGQEERGKKPRLKNQDSEGVFVLTLTASQASGLGSVRERSDRSGFGFTTPTAGNNFSDCAAMPKPSEWAGRPLREVRSLPQWPRSSWSWPCRRRLKLPNPHSTPVKRHDVVRKLVFPIVASPSTGPALVHVETTAPESTTASTS